METYNMEVYLRSHYTVISLIDQEGNYQVVRKNLSDQSHLPSFKAGHQTLVPRVLSCPSVEDSSISPIQKQELTIVEHKIPKMSPSKYKPPKPVTQETLR